MTIRIDSTQPLTRSDPIRSETEEQSETTDVFERQRGDELLENARYRPRAEFTDEVDEGVVANARAATILARLRRAGLFGDGDFASHGVALAAIVDASGVDALRLSSVVGHPPQAVLKALTAEVPWSELEAEIRGLGFDDPILDRPSAPTCLRFDPPAIFGLAGQTPLQGFQQQLLLRFSRTLEDSNHNGRADVGDAVRFIDEQGVTRTMDFADLDPEVVRLVEYNLATTRALRDYMELPPTAAMRFPGNGTRSVNEDFWTLTTTHGGALASALKPGVSPAAAIDDHFSGNGALYDPECAAFLVLARLKGRLEYYRARYGRDAGSYRFDADFGKRAHHVRRAKKYFQRYLDAGISWAEYSAAHPPPALEYAMQISPHRVRGDLERPLKLWSHMTTGYAGGDAGYFENLSVSHAGWEAGYGGENVIFLGYVDGVPLFYGHPDGCKTEQGWKDTLGKDSLKLNHMADYADYFSTSGVMMRVLAFSDQQIDLLGDRIEELNRRRPDGWEREVAALRSRAAWWRTVGEVRAAIATELQADRADSVVTFLDSDPELHGPEDLVPLLEALTEAGRRKAAAAFGHLHESDVARACEAFQTTELSRQQKALGALFVTLSSAAGKMDDELRGEIRQAVRNVEFRRVSSWIESGPLSSQKAFATWLASESFASWYAGVHGSPYAGSLELAEMTCQQIASIVETLLPMTRDMVTANSTLNGRGERLSVQMANLLKHGELADAEFRPNSAPILPRG